MMVMSNRCARGRIRSVLWCLWAVWATSASRWLLAFRGAWVCSQSLSLSFYFFASFVRYDTACHARLHFLSAPSSSGGLLLKHSGRIGEVSRSHSYAHTRIHPFFLSLSLVLRGCTRTGSLKKRSFLLGCDVRCRLLGRTIGRRSEGRLQRLGTRGAHRAILPRENAGREGRSGYRGRYARNSAIRAGR